MPALPAALLHLLRGGPLLHLRGQLFAPLCQLLLSPGVPLGDGLSGAGVPGMQQQLRDVRHGDDLPKLSLWFFPAQRELREPLPGGVLRVRQFGRVRGVSLQLQPVRQRLLLHWLPGGL
jgi:hypothetical protein